MGPLLTLVEGGHRGFEKYGGMWRRYLKTNKSIFLLYKFLLYKFLISKFFLDIDK